MDKLWTAARFVASVAMYYVTPTPPDFVLTEAASWTAATGEEDATVQVIAWLATSKTGIVVDTEAKRPKCADGKRLVVRYQYRGAGPYACYYEADDAVEFPPISKLAASEDDPTKIVKCLGDCVSVAEVVRGEEEEEVADITAAATAFAGPDGKWHGRSLEDKTMDPLMLYKDLKTGDTISVSFAGGETTEIKY
jgi:hypothetical protein